MTERSISAAQWRSIWEERMTADQRARIKRTVSRGEAVEDAEEATVAAEYAARARRAVVVGASITVVGYAVLLVVVLAVVRAPMTTTGILLTSTWAVVAVASAAMAWLRSRRFTRSRAANLARAARS